MENTYSFYMISVPDQTANGAGRYSEQVIFVDLKSKVDSIDPDQLPNNREIDFLHEITCRKDELLTVWDRVRENHAETVKHAYNRIWEFFVKDLPDFGKLAREIREVSGCIGNPNCQQHTLRNTLEYVASELSKHIDSDGEEARAEFAIDDRKSNPHQD